MRVPAGLLRCLRRAAWLAALAAVAGRAMGGEDVLEPPSADAPVARYDAERRALQRQVHAAATAPDPWERMPQIRLALAERAYAHGDLRFALRSLLDGLKWLTPETAPETRRRLFDLAVRVAVGAGFPGQARLILRRMERDGHFAATHPRAVGHLRAAEIAEAAFEFGEMEQALERFAGEVAGETCPYCIAEYWLLRTRAALRQRDGDKAATLMAEARRSLSGLAYGLPHAEAELAEALLLHLRGGAAAVVAEQLRLAREAFNMAGHPAHFPLGLIRLLRGKEPESLLRSEGVFLEALAAFADEEQNFQHTAGALAAAAELARRERRFEEAYAALRISRRKGDHANRVMAMLLADWEERVAGQPPPSAAPGGSSFYYLLTLVLILVVLVLLLALRVRTQQLLADRLRDLIEQSRRAEQAAAEANRLKSQFLANVSHEIKTPMAGLVGMVSVLDEVITDPVQRRYLDTVKTCSQNLLKLINNLLELSRMESGRFEIERVPFSLAETFQYCRGLVAAAAHQKGLELVAEIDASVPGRLIGDPLRIGQVLANLLQNAIQYTPRGRVSMRAVFHPAAGDGGEVVVEVRDTGVGIAPERLHTLFEPFSRKPQQGGTVPGGSGLGLAISRKLAQLMGGSLTVASRVGEGSAFTLRIPVGR